MLKVAPWARPVLLEYPHGYRKANLRGGRGRGASQALARLVIKAMLEHGHNVLIGREHQSSVKQSNIRLVKRIIGESVYAQHFDLSLKNVIVCRATNAVCEFKGIRLSLNDWRSLDDYQLVWLEEPDQVTDDQLDIILPSLREENQTLVASWNPLFEDSPIERLTKYRDALNFHTTYRDNPYFPHSLELERAEAERNRPPDVYEWVWEGAWKQIGTSNPFGAAAIAAAVEREWITPTKPETVAGVDVAYTENEGSDYTAVVRLDRAGNVLEARHFHKEEPEDRHEIINQLVEGTYYSAVDTTEASGRMAYLYLRKKGVRALKVPFTRDRKHTMVTYAANRLQEGRATLHNCPELVKEIRLFNADGTGKYEASVGHDDLVCAWLLAFEVLRQWEVQGGKD